jgi:RNA polymerase sigma-70 factor (ECF subfamily)
VTNVIASMDTDPVFEPSSLADATDEPRDATPDRELADDEATMLERLRRGDGDAFETLVRTQGGRMLAVARRLLRDEEEARDAVQEAFLSAFRSIDSFRGGCRLSTWLFRIVTNVAFMKLRSAARRPVVSIEELLPRFAADGHHSRAVFATTGTAEARLIHAERVTRVRECIERLPMQYRTVIVLRDFSGLSTHETAEILQLTDNAVKIRLHRARLALTELVHGRGVPAGDGGADPALAG